jgi:hypothetical protein
MKRDSFDYSVKRVRRDPDPACFRTPEFKKLLKEWNRRLDAEGFHDLERGLFYGPTTTFGDGANRTHYLMEAPTSPELTSEIESAHRNGSLQGNIWSLIGLRANSLPKGHPHRQMIVETAEEGMLAPVAQRLGIPLTEAWRAFRIFLKDIGLTPPKKVKQKRGATKVGGNHLPAGISLHRTRATTRDAFTVHVPLGGGHKKYIGRFYDLKDAISALEAAKLQHPHHPTHNNKKTPVKFEKDGVVLTFSSQREASRHFDIGEGQISDRLKNGYLLKGWKVSRA